jgi:hypothetical protein
VGSKIFDGIAIQADCSGTPKGHQGWIKTKELETLRQFFTFCVERG